MPTPKQIKEEAARKQEALDAGLDAFDEIVREQAEEMVLAIQKLFLARLSTQSGIVSRTAENLAALSLIDRAWNDFLAKSAPIIMSEFLYGMENISEANLKYYRLLSDANIRPGDIKNIINARLGIDDNGNLVKGGYMKGLLDDVSVRNEIKKFTYQKIISGTGFEDLKTGLQNLISGNPEQLGKFEQFYRTYAYDTYVQVDRLNSTLYAEKLGLKYFIYQGTRRKGSRPFCLARKGKVFTTEEAAEWHRLIGKRGDVTTDKGTRNMLIGPIVDDAATYNPLVDLGGYGCVDTVAYISKEIAFAMRPELKEQAA